MLFYYQGRGERGGGWVGGKVRVSVRSATKARGDVMEPEVFKDTDIYQRPLTQVL